MLAKRELRKYSGDTRVWVGKYRNLDNLPHWHSDCEIIYADKGSATVYINGEAIILREAQTIYVESKKTHYIKADQGSVLTFFLFDSKLVKSIVQDTRLINPVLRKDYGLDKLFEIIDRELSERSQLYALSVNNRIERLVIDIFSNEEITTAPADENYHTARYKLLLKEIDEKYDNYSLSSASKFCGLSESYFSKFFKKMADMTFSQYLNLVKVEKAIEILRREDVTMTKVAIDCGFGTIRNFNRVFKDITGFNPKSLPASYDTLGMHPTYSVEDTFNPTSENSELL
ncbi:MAG: helix-turn-helix transcriptional regulator [Clostridia bacterium]|nr:helix-turn-helix transcriptional regulator [Clostridia bacterium]